MAKKEEVKAINDLLEEREAILLRIKAAEEKRQAGLSDEQKESEKIKQTNKEMADRLRDVEAQITKARSGASGLGNALQSIAPSANQLLGFAVDLVGSLGKAKQEAISLAVAYGRIEQAEALANRKRAERTFALAGAYSGRPDLEGAVSAVTDKTKEKREAVLSSMEGLRSTVGGDKEALALTDTLASRSKQFGTDLAGMQGIGHTLGAMLKDVEDAPAVLDEIAGMADRLGTVGGPRALAEQFTHLGNSLAGLSASQAKTALATLAEMTKDVHPARRAEVQANLIASLKGNAARIKSETGISLTTSTGELDFTKLGTFQQWLKRRERGINESFRVEANAGIVGGAQNAKLFESADLSDIRLRQLTGARARRSAATAEEDYRATETGKDEARERKDEARADEAMKKTLSQGRRNAAALSEMDPSVRDFSQTMANSSLVRWGAMGSPLGHTGTDDVLAALPEVLGQLNDAIRGMRDPKIEINTPPNDDPAAYTAKVKAGSPGKR